MNDMILDAIREDAKKLIETARNCDAVMTVTLKPLEPLAMGNYEMVVDVRPARQRAAPPAPGFDLDIMCNAAMAGITAWVALDAERHKSEVRKQHTEALGAMNARYDQYGKESRQRRWVDLTGAGFHEAAEALRRFGALARLTPVSQLP